MSRFQRDYPDGGQGNQLGTAQTESVSVSDGLFTVLLNNSDQFGPETFNGQARWLEISVACPGDSGYTSLGGQPLTATPYAHYAASTGALEGQPEAASWASGGYTLTGGFWPAGGTRSVRLYLPLIIKH